MFGAPRGIAMVATIPADLAQYYDYMLRATQYIMGHSDISVTLNVYTHVGFEDAKAEINRLKAM